MIHTKVLQHENTELEMSKEECRVRNNIIKIMLSENPDSLRLKINKSLHDNVLVARDFTEINKLPATNISYSKHIGK